jgi:hypothetical protein
MQTMDLQDIMKKNPHLDPLEMERIRKFLESNLGNKASYRLAMEPRKVRVGSVESDNSRMVKLRNQR